MKMLTIWVISKWQWCPFVKNNILLLPDHGHEDEVKSVCLNFKFYLSFYSVMDFKSLISSSVCEKLSSLSIQTKS